MMCPESRFFPREQAQPAKKDKQSRSQSPRAPQSAVDCQVRPNRLKQSPWSLGKSTQRSNALRARSSQQKLLQEFPKSFALKPKVKAVTEKFRFIHHLCIGNLKIVFHWVSQLELFFHSAIFTTFSYQSLTDFRFQLLQSTRQRKPEVALDFAFDRCEGKALRSQRWNTKSNATSGFRCLVLCKSWKRKFVRLLLEKCCKNSILKDKFQLGSPVDNNYQISNV